ncbi:MAG: phage holin family protein [Thermoleophilaceae bacterium]|nr:phage holin family protein [Thermoleophilaceae bacterium]
MNGNRVDKSLGEIVQEVSEKASLLVRQEIDLAKAEVTGKVTKLGKGAAVGAAAGVFLIFALFIFLFFLAFLIVDLFDFDVIWPGFLAVFVLLVILAAVAGYYALRFIKSGGAPTPDMAIEEAKLTKAQFDHEKVERDQLDRSPDRLYRIEKGP